MPEFTLEPFTVIAAEHGHTLAKVLRSRLHAQNPSWSDVKRLIEIRKVKIGDAVATDPARRLKEGEQVVVLTRSDTLPRGASVDDLVIRHLDDHVVVVEKPTGMNTVRHPAELEWPEQRRRLDPTLQDLLQWGIAKRLHMPAKAVPPLRIVQRLDRETSGLVVFARSPLAEQKLGMQFRKHTVVRRYLAIIPGYLSERTIRTNLVRDRGDGRRGSTKLPSLGKEAITHITVEERLPGFTVLSCRLETGRTHQIRIHLSESGHPICGEKVYTRRPTGEIAADDSGAPRLALHAIELGFEHPVTGEQLHWTMPMPADLSRFLALLRNRKTSAGS